MRHQLAKRSPLLLQMQFVCIHLASLKTISIIIFTILTSKISRNCRFCASWNFSIPFKNEALQSQGRMRRNGCQLPKPHLWFLTLYAVAATEAAAQVHTFYVLPNAYPRNACRT